MSFQWTHKLIKQLAGLGIIALVAVAAFAGFRLAQSQMAADVYRQRLAELNQHYDELRTNYNQAIRKTAVTELLVEDGQVSVTVRNAEGVQRTIPTNLDPNSEIYVDYVVVDGRLWIRRVFDADTPASRGVVIDPDLAQVNWDAPNVNHGKATYRQLNEGRWIVTVTGSGALGLAEADHNEDIDLTPPPRVRDYDEVENEVRNRLQQVTFRDVIDQLTSRD